MGREHTFYFAGGVASYQSIKEEGKIKKGRKMEVIDIEEAGADFLRQETRRLCTGLLNYGKVKTLCGNHRFN